MARRFISSNEIMELMAETIEQLSMMIDNQHAEIMAEITADTAIEQPMTARILDRYTPFHLSYYAETANV